MRKNILLTFMCVLTALCAHAQTNPYSSYTRQLPFSMPEVAAPVFPKKVVSLSEYGVKGDGKTLCTEAFRKAIDALSSQGGGRLSVPQGVWFTGPIVLKSHVELHLEKGAVILFSGDMDLYPVIETNYEGELRKHCQSPVSAVGQTDIAITGQGIIDGNGICWRPLKKEKVTEGQWKKFTSKGGVFPRSTMWYPSEERVKMRPVLLYLESCKNVLLQGVVFQNSPNWCLHPLMCENLIVDGVMVRNPAYAQNGDALDLESCKNALIVNSKFDAGDDGICIKSGKDKDGRRRGRPCENVVVDGCTVFAGHGGFVVGSEMSGGVRNILVENCQFLGTDVGLRFKSTRGRGGIVENININNISMTDIKTDAITFNMYYGGKSVAEMLADGDNPDNQTKMPVNEETPIFRNINIKNIVCNDAGRAMEFNGLPEMPIDGITLENVMIQAKKDAVFSNYKNLTKKNVVIKVIK
jgi:polygalacturonase